MNGQSSPHNPKRGKETGMYDADLMAELAACASEIMGVQPAVDAAAVSGCIPAAEPRPAEAVAAAGGLDEVRTVLARSTMTSSRLDLPPGTLPRPVWEAVHATLTGMGATGGSRKGQPYRFATDRTADLRRFVAGGPPPKHERATVGWVRTPAGLAADVVARFTGATDVAPGEVVRVLEPSAGDGALLRAFLDACRGLSVITALEPDDGRRAALNQLADEVGRRRFANISGSTLEEYADVPSAVGRFGLVLMNPPYSVPGNRTIWVDHVLLAWKLLAEGGRLVAILPTGIRQRRDRKTTAMLAELGPDAQIEELPARSFRESGTDVRTCVLTATKLSAADVKRPARRYAGCLYRPVVGDPVRVTDLTLTARAAADRPVQAFYGWGGDTTVRYVGACIGCSRPTWSDGNNDPRGALGRHAVQVLGADEYGMQGPDVCLCWGCADDGGMYRRGVEKAQRLWKPNIR